VQRICLESNYLGKKIRDFPPLEIITETGWPDEGNPVKVPWRGEYCPFRRPARMGAQLAVGIGIPLGYLWPRPRNPPPFFAKNRSA
jgi:hypothetical protein